MAKEETAIANKIMMDSSRHGCTLWRNVKGLFDPPKRKRKAEGLSPAPDRELSVEGLPESSGRKGKILAGLLAPGSSDLIGFRRVKITPEMVGQTIAQFVAIEVKKDSNSYASPNQKDFCEFIAENGGLSGVARTVEDSRRICKIKLDRP